MRMNWLALALYLVGAIVVTMAEGDERSADRHGAIAPSPAIRVLTTAVVDPARLVKVVVSAQVAQMNRAQAGARNDDLEPLAPVSLVPSQGVHGRLQR